MAAHPSNNAPVLSNNQGQIQASSVPNSGGLGSLGQGFYPMPNPGGSDSQGQGFYPTGMFSPHNNGSPSQFYQNFN